MPPNSARSKTSKRAPQAAKADASSKPAKPLLTIGTLRSPALFPFLTFPVQVYCILGIIFLAYINTLGLGYAVDDPNVITGNKFTKEGLKGIDDILGKDSFLGFMEQNVLPGGRYRPLSIVTFAIEWQFFGENPLVSHLLNVAMYFGLALLLLRFLHKYLFPDKPALAFLTTILFTVHPVHIEVVTNLKGRDELLALLLLVAALYAHFKFYAAGRNDRKWFWTGLGLYFLALLSKETPITFLAVLPAMLHIFTRATRSMIVRDTAAWFGVVLLYFAIRFSITGINLETLEQDIMQDPYLYATTSEKYATIIFVLGKYLGLLFWPTTFSWDYSYNQIPYRDFGDAIVLFLLVLHLALFVFALYGVIKKKSVAALGVWIYLASISIVSNAVFNLGGMMGERFLFTPSLGFAIAVTSGLIFAFEKLKITRPTRAVVLIGIYGIITLLAIPKIFSRNQDWKNNYTLFPVDAANAPNSAKIQKSAGEAYLQRGIKAKNDKNAAKADELLKKSVFHLKRAIEIHPEFEQAWYDLGSAYHYLEEADKSAEVWSKAAKKFPGNKYTPMYFKGFVAPQYHSLGLQIMQNSQIAERLDKAAPYFEKALKFDPEMAAAYTELGKIYYDKRDLPRSMEYLKKAVELAPKNPAARYYLGTVYGMAGRPDKALAALEKAVEFADDPPLQYWYDLGGLYFTNGQYGKALEAWQNVYAKNPNFPSLQQGMNAARARMGR